MLAARAATAHILIAPLLPDIQSMDADRIRCWQIHGLRAIGYIGSDCVRYGRRSLSASPYVFAVACRFPGEGAGPLGKPEGEAGQGSAEMCEGRYGVGPRQLGMGA